MVFCPECGVGHCSGVAAVTDAEVRIAEINAKRDIEVARLAKAESAVYAEAGVAETEIEAEAQVDEATIKAGVLGEVLDEVLTPPEEEPTPVTVVSEGGDGGEAEIPAAEPPEADPAGSSPGSGRNSNPWW